MADEKYEVEVEKDVQDTGQDEKDIEVYDDTPEEDQNREPTAGELEIDEDEISTYGQNVQKRIRQLSKKMHDFRREKEQHLREKEEAIRYAQALVEQNRLYQEQLSRAKISFSKVIRTGLLPASLKRNEITRKRMSRGILKRCSPLRRSWRTIRSNSGM
jgi:hypothetical protein